MIEYQIWMGSGSVATKQATLTIKYFLFYRNVAQLGSAPCSGRGGRRFKSCHSDFLIYRVKGALFETEQPTKLLQTSGWFPTRKGG